MAATDHFRLAPCGNGGRPGAICPWALCRGLAHANASAIKNRAWPQDESPDHGFSLPQKGIEHFFWIEQLFFCPERGFVVRCCRRSMDHQAIISSPLPPRRRDVPIRRICHALRPPFPTNPTASRSDRMPRSAPPIVQKRPLPSFWPARPKGDDVRWRSHRPAPQKRARRVRLARPPPHRARL